MTAFLTATLFLLAPPQDPTPRTWDVDGVQRVALVYAPSKATAGKVPLVFDFHGHGGTARHAARTHHFHADVAGGGRRLHAGAEHPRQTHRPRGQKSRLAIRPRRPEGPRPEVLRRGAGVDEEGLPRRREPHLRDRPLQWRGLHLPSLGERGATTFAAFAPVAAAAGLYFADARPKPLFHAASEKDPLVTFAMQQRTLDRVKKLNGCGDEGEDWAKGCRRYPSKSGAPVVIYLHGEGHKYPEATPELIVKFFQEQAKK